MRVLSLISLSVLLVSCKDAINHKELTSDTGVKIMVVSAKLDTAFVCVPKYYDTSFSWLDTFDCRYSQELKFQFQQRKLKAIKDNCVGSSSLYLDTADRIVLSFSEAPFSLKHTSSDSLTFYNFHLQKIEETTTSAMGFSIPFDTLQNINGHLYSIFLVSIHRNASQRFSRKMYATTIIGRQLISFTYEAIDGKTNLTNEKFLSNSMYYLTRSNPGNGM
jgi:hypothetical protein